MSTSKEYKAVRNYILNELHLTKEDIIKNIEPLLEKLVKRCMLNTYGGNNQIEHWIRCMVTDELKQRDHNFVRRACESVIRDHVLNELNIIVRSKSEKCTCENRVPSEEDKKKSTDGLYIIYKDGHVEPFTGDNSKDCVRYIGLKHRYMSFAISLTEHDIVQLLDDDSREESGSGTYYERECDALFDIDGRGNTERLVARNPKLRNLLEDGEYIPSLGQLNLMAHYMDELNKAFTYVSASPLSSTWYWSSTESSQAVAWYVVFSSGLTGTGNKHIGDIVPNPSVEWTGNYENGEWRDGTSRLDALNAEPFGFSIYAKPFLKRVIEYGNGEKKVEYDRLNAEKGTYTHWLNCVAGMSYNRYKPVMEVECNECTSKLFVDMIKSICKISEQIKSFINPEQIKAIAESNEPILLLSNN